MNSLADKPTEQLADYVRRLNPAVTPTLARVLSVFTRDPVSAWKKDRFEVLDALDRLDRADAPRLAQLGRQFYQVAGKRGMLKEAPERCREVIGLGFEIIDLGRAIGLAMAADQR